MPQVISLSLQKLEDGGFFFWGSSSGMVSDPTSLYKHGAD
jgi:hypothetical protein